MPGSAGQKNRSFSSFHDTNGTVRAIGAELIFLHARVRSAAEGSTAAVQGWKTENKEGEKEMKHAKGIAAIMAFALFVTISGSNLMFTYANVVNSALNVSTTEVVQTEGDEENTVLFDNPYGTDVNSRQATMQVEMDAAAENIREVEEGVVLLKNDNGALPLSGSDRITLFGNGSFNTIGTSTDTAFDAIPTVDFATAMKNAFGEENVNTVLLDEVYSSMSATTSSVISEAEIGEVEKRASSWADDYNDAAIVVLSRAGGEDDDNALLTDEGRHYITLSQNESDLLNYLKEQKDQGIFKKIIVILNADQMMEVGWLDEYEVDSCLVLGQPGSVGLTGLGNILIGSVSPSGHLTDTMVTDSFVSPAITYTGANTMTWGNTDWMNTVCTDNNNDGASIFYYTIYADGIYVGYKYYETRYEDCVLGNGNADSEVGSSQDGAWNYANEVVYPFGYGLSYTDFDQKLDSVAYNEETDSYDVNVTVTNTGDVAGRSVVEVYAQTPYGDYEKQNGVEKSSIILGGFEKTDTLEPGESQQVTVSVERYFLASYDENNAKGYILSAGDYYLAIGNNAHDALNNVLAAKGMTTSDGMDYDGNADKVYSWNQTETDTETYRTSRYNDTEVTNQFDFADLNYYGYDLTYLSRSDWADTFPTEAMQLDANEQVVSVLNSGWYTIPEDAPAVSDFTQGADNGLTFAEMRNVDFDDDDTWNLFLDQLTVEEMADLTLDGNGVGGVDRVGLPAIIRDDDCTGLSRAALISVGKTGIQWVTEALTARTWSKERFAEKGKMQAIEATYSGVSDIWYGGGNIHRTPYGGKNRYYCSEDGIYGYIETAVEASAMQSYGVTYTIKHMTLNDQEGHREGISTFCNEQSMREVYLKPFEGAVCEGGALGIMTSFNRIGSNPCASCKEMIQNVLKGEWGFKGHVTTDGYTSSQLYKKHYMEDYAAGNDYYCLDSSDHGAAITEAVNSGDGYMLSRLREATKRNIYVDSRTIAENGLNSNTKIITIVPAWEKILLTMTMVFFVGLVIFGTMAVIYACRNKEAKA